MNCVHFQLAMLAYNLNCWLLLFQREEQAQVEQLQHTTLGEPEQLAGHFVDSWLT
jgi:hypothetical protein